MIAGEPGGAAGARVALHSSEFAADPHRVYAEMRAMYGDMAPVELAPGVPATLVLGHATARRILHDPEHFPADPRVWQREHLPAGCPITTMLEWRPNALRSTGAQHARYRSATVDAVAAIDTHALHRTLEQIAMPLISKFAPAGQADLMDEYAFPVMFGALNAIVGCPAGLGKALAAAFAGMFDSQGDPADINAAIVSALADLIAVKRAQPGDDIATRLLAHPAGLDDTELIHQLVTMYAAGIEPGRNLIGNTLRLILTDPQFAGDVIGGALAVGDALDQVLFNDPPLANLCVTYPPQPVLVSETWLSAHYPVVISMAACNTDPQVRAAAEQLGGNRSHLAFSAGPHACPAASVAYQIARHAVEQLLDVVPDVALGCPASELSWRPGPFHRSLAALPVTFPPV